MIVFIEEQNHFLPPFLLIRPLTARQKAKTTRALEAPSGFTAGFYHAAESSPHLKGIIQTEKHFHKEIFTLHPNNVLRQGLKPANVVQAGETRG
jgi:hypothetical protein